MLLRWNAVLLYRGVRVCEYDVNPKMLSIEQVVLLRYSTRSLIIALMPRSVLELINPVSMRILCPRQSISSKGQSASVSTSLIFPKMECFTVCGGVQAATHQLEGEGKLYTVGSAGC